MPPPPNAESVNDRAKLLTHRIIARQMTTDPYLIPRARQVISEWRSQGQHYSFLDNWDRLTHSRRPPLRRLITSRSEGMTRLRTSSSLGLASSLFVNDEPLRRRIRRKPKSCLLLAAKRNSDAAA